MELLHILGEMNIKIHNLTKKFDSFKNDIRNQSSLVVKSLGENNVAIENIVKTQIPKYTKVFPIKSLDDLKKLDESINDSNEKEYIASVRAIVGKRGLKKGLADLVAPDVLMHFNLDGVHHKMRLLDYQKLINIICLGSYDHERSEKSFKEEFKYALKLVKNRVFKEKVKSKDNTTQLIQ